MSMFSKTVRKVTNTTKQAVSQPFKFIEDATGLNFSQPFKSNPLALLGIANPMTIGTTAGAIEVVKKNPGLLDPLTLLNPIIGPQINIGKKLLDRAFDPANPDSVPPPNPEDAPKPGDPDYESSLAARRRRLSALRGGLLSTMRSGRLGRLGNTAPALGGY